LSRSRSTSNSERQLADVDQVFAALAHASRRHILLVLRFRGGAMTAGEIADRFSCSWPTTSRHLRLLEEAGLVQVEQQGRERVYRLVADRLLGVTRGWLRWFEGRQAPSSPRSQPGKKTAPPTKARARRRPETG
jgi:DNA-binding transcriptional ArsR family regulator